MPRPAQHVELADQSGPGGRGHDRVEHLERARRLVGSPGRPVRLEHLAERAPGDEPADPPLPQQGPGAELIDRTGVRG